MLFDRLLGDRQLAGDLAIRATGGSEIGDFALALRQFGKFLGDCRVGRSVGKNPASEATDVGEGAAALEERQSGIALAGQFERRSFEQWRAKAPEACGSAQAERPRFEMAAARSK